MIADCLKTIFDKNSYHVKFIQFINMGKNQFIGFYLIGSFSASDSQTGFSFSGLSKTFCKCQ